MTNQESIYGSANDCVAEQLTKYQAYMLKALSFGEIEIAPEVFLIRTSPYSYQEYPNLRDWQL